MVQKKSPFPTTTQAGGWLREYITTENISEDAKDDKGLAVFRSVFGAELVKETQAANADGYVEGKLVVELKSKYADWKAGFFQALHYRKKGLSFHYISVLSYHFVGLWDVRQLPAEVLAIAQGADPADPASQVGKEQARLLSEATWRAVLDTALFLITEEDFRETKKEREAFGRNAQLKGLDATRLFEFISYLRNLDAGRIQVNTANFIHTIQQMMRFFDQPIEAVHAFYALIHYWDTSAEVTLPGEYAVDNWGVQVYARISGRRSEPIVVNPKYHADFKKFVEARFVFTNEGSGLTLDYYFSRFDEVLAVLDPEYVKQHGIFFTDDHLAKFALWFVHQYAEAALSEKYIVLDPAAGSGNLVTSWRLKLRHKIVSELQPDLLRIIERRMKYDPLHLQQGFTIVPKTHTGQGLNFLDKPAAEYLGILEQALVDNGQQLDKPLAFLLNPPYKSTDERTEQRESVQAEYEIDSDVMALTGQDAGKERYAAFLAQILLICQVQVARHPGWKPLLMIFTPSSWLVPRPTYAEFRSRFDEAFQFYSGFMVNAREFFKLNGNWPVSFTVWQYAPQAGRQNQIRLHDYTHWTHEDLSSINWLDHPEALNASIQRLVKASDQVLALAQRGDIRETIPEIGSTRQTRYDFSHAKREKDYGKVVSGFSVAFKDGHYRLKRKCGEVDGAYVGFMDNLTPVRVKQDRLNRMSRDPARVWFRLDNDVKSTNKTRAQAGPPDKYGFCAFDYESAVSLIGWYGITKFLNGYFPLATNQLDIWAPSVPKKKLPTWLSLCFSFLGCRNSCIETTFEADNPVAGAPRIEVQNPMAPYLADNFYNTVLAPHLPAHPVAKATDEAVRQVYDAWLRYVTRGKGRIAAPCLADEPYFCYFAYPAYVGPHAGLVQIRSYATAEGVAEVLDALDKLTTRERELQAVARTFLLEELNYFG